MNESEVMTLLSDANPVRAGDLPEAPSDLLDSILVLRPRPARRLVLVGSAAAVALAASLIGVFAFGEQTSQRVVSGRGASTSIEALPGRPLTIAHPLAEWAKRTTLAKAPAALGGPVVLPHSALVGPSDVGPVWVASLRGRPNGEGTTTVAITFPLQRVIVEYTQPAPSTGSAARFHAMAQSLVAGSGAQIARVITLSGGVPALSIRQNSDETRHNFGVIIFNVAGSEVRVLGHYDEATLKPVAESILDRFGASTPAPDRINLLPSFPSRKRIPLGRASATLGAPVVLPAPWFAKPSDVFRIWAQGTCPPAARHWPCSIWIRFPSLTLIYERPAPWRPSLYKQIANHSGPSRLIELNRVPGLEIPPKNDGRNPGSIDFIVDGTRVVVAGYRTRAALQAIAKSIVNRSGF
jgi:hypothetical protein